MPNCPIIYLLICTHLFTFILGGGGGGAEGGEWVLLDGWLLAQQHYCWFRIAQETNFAPLYHSDDEHIVYGLFKT